ncbi:alpha/beta fold hydrolase [Glaciecola sp. SC05]|uniref:alpha/beta fold hydrolase n=1 Tax=Glaciecola sp. SC05 TaxID=1987355 RepID=UPI003527065F
MYLSNEQQLASYYQVALPKFISEKMQVGDWQRSDTYHLHYRYVIKPSAKAWVVIMQGRAESVVKYAELMDELHQNGFSVFAFDHIGQGQSGRLTENPLHGFVEDFDAYVEDSAALISGVMQDLKSQYQQRDLPQYLLSHSMGGAIATLLLEKYPQLFNKAVLSSPMYGIQAPIPDRLARLLVTVGAAVHRILGISSGYFLGQGDYKAVDFTENKLTSSKLRYDWFKQYYNDNVDARLGGVTFQWLAAALHAMDHIVMHANRIDTPVLGFKAGSDEIVNNEVIDQVFASLPNAELVEIVGARHEILFEQDRFRQQAVIRILQFFLS